MSNREFRLNVKLDNAAFDDGNESAEIARIIRAIADRIDSGEFYGHSLTIRDINGNDVGRFAAKNISQF